MNKCFSNSYITTLTQKHLRTAFTLAFQHIWIGFLRELVSKNCSVLQGIDRPHSLCCCSCSSCSLFCCSYRMRASGFQPDFIKECYLYVGWSLGKLTKHPHTQHHCWLVCFPLQHVFLTRAGSEYPQPALSHTPVEGSRSAAWGAPAYGSVRSSFCRVRGVYKTLAPAADRLASTQVLE